ncbi:cyclodeaminase/cyclohydrolase family protein [uncultured Dialister sp.]|uniref:cyclodeaminase/cyclohydrolase family protein n=1 Tax=uncultured Dialister sp. TaxID=278064 RepID=UPI002613ACF0|nr:cyclodeaminase/cyclohydrolase family protein [uncultured Dialister sp.]
MEKKAFRERTIDEFLDDLGSRSPAPGGGAAAGLLGAQACSLAEMVCHLTESNKNYAQFHEKAKEYAAVFNMARSIFLDLMDEDAANFMELMETLRSIRNLPLEERQEKQLEAFKRAIAVPQQMAQTMSDLLPSFTNLLLKGNKNAISDSIMAAQSAIACIHASIINVKINMKYIDDEFYEHEMKDTITTWENAVSAIDAVLTYQVDL